MALTQLTEELAHGAIDHASPFHSRTCSDRGGPQRRTFLYRKAVDRIFDLGGRNDVEVSEPAAEERMTPDREVLVVRRPGDRPVDVRKVCAALSLFQIQTREARKRTTRSLWNQKRPS